MILTCWRTPLYVIHPISFPWYCRRLRCSSHTPRPEEEEEEEEEEETCAEAPTHLVLVLVRIFFEAKEMAVEEMR